jgi:RNA-binding protein 39
LSTKPFPVLSTNSDSEIQQVGGATHPAPTSDNGDYVTRNIRISHMFTPEEAQKDPNFDKTLEGDVGLECSKFGNVVHVFVDKNSTLGYVYIRFSDETMASRAHTVMNGRWFAKRQLKSEYLSDTSFNAKTGRQ